MLWIFLTIVFALVGTACLLVGTLVGKGTTSDGEEYDIRAVAIAPFILVPLWLILTFFFALHTVDAGHVGVVYEFGSIRGQTGDGAVFTAPWQTLREANTQVQTLAFVDEENKVPDGATRVGAGLDSFSKETQNVYIDAILNIEVSPDEVQELYRNVGPSYVNKLVPGRISQIFKDETVNYAAVEIAPNRETIRANVEEQLRAELRPFSIDVTALLVENIAFDALFQDKITEKAAASQEALRQQELVQAAKFEAQQAVETAAGTAEANRLVAQSLTPAILQFQAIEALGDNIQIALLPAGQGIIIDPTTLFGGVVGQTETP